ncbi:MAG: hypothetical protein ACRD1O_07815 [Terriglobia bacterium]
MKPIVANRCLEIMALIFRKPGFIGRRLKARVWRANRPQGRWDGKARKRFGINKEQVEYGSPIPDSDPVAAPRRKEGGERDSVVPITVSG